MSLINKAMEISPYPEMLLRRIYYSLRDRSSKLMVKQGGTIHKDAALCKTVNTEDFFEHLRSLGIKEGDILIVHSSTEGLERLDCRANELVEKLKALVGENGTLVFPAFPDENRLKEKDGIKVYHPQKSVAWTGMLPNLMLRMKGAVRSEFPCNPLVAYGPHAKEMMSHNLETDLAHSQNSCWGYCVSHHARILYLGIPAYHSCTIVHTLEDYQPDFWPQDWYEQKEYIISGITDKHIRVRVRAQKWSMYIAEKYSESSYIKNGLIRDADYQGINVRIIDDCNCFVNTILDHWMKYRFFHIPKRKMRWDKRIRKM